MPEMPELVADAPAEAALAAVPSEPYVAEEPEPATNGRRGNGFFAR
jgi:hypothetical protein